MARHMLLVGGSREIHPKLKSLGLRLSLLFAMPVLKRNIESLKLYERIHGVAEDATTEEWVDAARLLHRRTPFDCIGAFNERAQEHAAVIARELGLPFLSPETIRLTRQKDAMRAVLRQAGLDGTMSALVESPDDVTDFAAKHGYPLVLKPVDGRASMGVSIVRSASDIPTAFAWFKHGADGHRMLAEQFLEGEEWSVEAFSERGRHRIVCVTQKFKDPTTCVETGHCLPAPLAEEVRASIERFVESVLTAIGLDNGPSHTEVIVTKDGPRIVETHARLAGDSIVELIQLSSGVDLDELWARQCAGESVIDRVPSTLGRFASIAFVTPRAVGTLERVDGAADALAQPGVVRIELLQEPGAHMEGAHDSHARGACAIALGDSAAQASKQAREAAERLRFVVSCTG